MKKLLISALAVTVGLALAPAGLASAQVDEPTLDEPALDEPTVEGAGWLRAKGSGSADIDMGGRLRVWVNGDVILTDHAGDMRFEVNGGDGDAAAVAESGLDVILNDFAGDLRVQGSDFSILIDGETKLAAHGRGQAWLEGQGVYKTRYGHRMLWDGMAEFGGAVVDIAA